MHINHRTVTAVEIRPATPPPRVTGIADAAQKTSINSTEFSDAKSTIEYLRTYVKGLNEFAARFKAERGVNPKDQDFPVEVIKMVPPDPTARSVLIIGGMGPLAGAQAMEAALHKFGDDREVVLMQLCSTPDRTAALAEDRSCGGVSGDHVKVVDAMASGFVEAQEHLCAMHLGKAHMVVACNTAHNFVPEAFQKYKETQGMGAVIESDSLVECVRDRLQGETKPVLILGTDGTRKTQLYTKPLMESGVKCVNLGDEDQAVLMGAIYKGVKAFDAESTLKFGEQLFQGLGTAGQIDPQQGCVVLSACTEVPEMLNTLKEHGSESVKQLLAGVEVVDPVTVALEHISTADAKQAALDKPTTGILVDPGAKN